VPQPGEVAAAGCAGAVGEAQVEAAGFCPEPQAGCDGGGVFEPEAGPATGAEPHAGVAGRNGAVG